MRRLWLALLLVSAPVSAWAQAPYVAFDQIDVSTSAIGLTDALIRGSGTPDAVVVLCRLQGAQIRFRFDGGAPTTSVGVPLEVGQDILLPNTALIRNFKAIRTGGTDGRLNCFYMDSIATISQMTSGLALALSGGAASGEGGGSGDASFSEQQTQSNILTDIEAGVDGLETLATDIEADTTAILTAVDGLETLVDGLETLATAGNVSLAAMDTDLTTLIAAVDGLETLVTATNTAVDGIETLIGTSNTALSVIQGDTTDIETSVELIDNAIFLDGGAWSDGVSYNVLIGGLYQASPQTVTTGTVAPLQITSTGALKVDGTFSLDLLDSGDDDLTLDAADAMRVVLVGTTGTAYDPVVDYVQDGLAPANPSGPTQLMLRDDSLSAVTPPEGDWIVSRGTSRGALWVAVDGEVTTTTLNGYVDGLEAYVDGLEGSVDGIEALLTTANTNTGNIATYSQPGSIDSKISLGLTEDEKAVKASAGVVYAVSAWNKNTTTPAYMKCWNATTANTAPGTTVPVFRMIIPANTGGGGFAFSIPPGGVTFDTAITCGLVTGSADSSVAEVVADEVGWNVVYR
jgi:hypothetical protein